LLTGDFLVTWGMNYLTVILGIVLGLHLNVEGQQFYRFEKPDSTPIDYSKGFNIPVFDTIRVLYLCVQFRSEEEKEEHSRWPIGSQKAPDFLKKIVSPTPDHFPTGSLSAHFYEASFGRMVYYGEVFQDVITLDSLMEYYHIKGGYTAITEEVIKKVAATGKVNWKLYDQWGRKEKNWVKNPDKIIDHIVLLFRDSPPKVNSKYGWTGTSAGIAALHGGMMPVGDSLFVHGGSLMSGLIVNGAGTLSEQTTLEYIKHETGHFLTLWHYSATNDNLGGPDLNAHGGWGMASASGSSSICVNSWDRDFLSWGKFSHIFRAEKDSNCEITLTDFVTTGASVKIIIPHVEQQYYLLEFHNNKSVFDHVDSTLPALFILHQTGDRGPHHLDVEEADGRYDYQALEKKPTVCCGNHWHMRKLSSNPLLGFGDRDAVFLDKDLNGRLDRNDVLGAPVFMVEGDQPEELIHYLGDGGDGFTTEDGRNDFGIDTNPASGSNGKYLRHPITELNGIRVKVLAMYPDSIRLALRFNDYTIERSVRWSGDIRLRDSLLINSGKILELVTSGSFMRMQDTFPAGHLRVDSLASIYIGKGSSLVINRKCSLMASAGAHIYLDKNASIKIEKGGRLLAEPSQLHFLHRSAKVVDKNLEISPKRKLKISSRSTDVR
jgi:M6 family metalloprotease-like protein